MSAPAATEKQKSVIAQPMVWRLLVVALLAEIGYAVLNISTMPVYLKAAPTNTFISNGRGFGESIIGLVLVAFLLSEAIFKSPMGHLADKVGAKNLMLIGPCLSVATSLLSLVVPHNGGATETLAFVLLRALDGLGAAMLWPAAFAEMGAAVTDSERQQAMSLLNLCYMLGIALALPVGGIVNDTAGVKWAGLIFAAVLFGLVAVAVFLFIPNVKVKALEADPAHETSIKDFFHSLKQIPVYLVLAIVVYAGIGFPMPIIKIFAQDAFQMSESAFGLLVLPGAITMAILSVPMSKLGERIGRIKAVHYGMGLCAVGLGVIASGAVIPWLRQSWVLAVGGMPVGVGFLLAIPAWMASVSDIDPRRRATNLGAIMTAQGLGAIIGAPLGAYLYEHMQPVGEALHLGKAFGYYSPWIGCAACVAAGWLLSLKILREPK